MSHHAHAALAVVGALMSACAAMDENDAVAGLDGTAWVLASIPGRELANGAPATLQFRQGRAGGRDGCNQYSGMFRAGTSKLEFSSLTSTLMACPPGVQQQAQWFTDALQGTRAWRVADDRLHLLDAGGRELATLVAQRRQLAGTRWSATAINNGTGGVASLVAGTRVTLDFSPDGTLSGSASCNDYTGRYVQDGAALQVVPPAVTRKLCGAPGVMDQETAFLRALAAGTVIRIDGDRLELRDAAGSLQVSARGD